MNITYHIEKILRYRFFWILILPIIIIISICLIVKEFIGFGTIIAGIILFPAISLGLYLEGISYLLVIIFIYSSYIFFIIKLKKLDKRLLYWISLIFLILAILGIKGCSSFSYPIGPFF
jgi:hypothetical protein